MGYGITYERPDCGYTKAIMLGVGFIPQPEKRPYLCPACRALLSLPEPETTCPDCGVEAEPFNPAEGVPCPKCKKGRLNITSVILWD